MEPSTNLSTICHLFSLLADLDSTKASLSSLAILCVWYCSTAVLCQYFC